jgi:hypothetical protein
LLNILIQIPSYLAQLFANFQLSLLKALQLRLLRSAKNQGIVIISALL